LTAKYVVRCRLGAGLVAAALVVPAGCGGDDEPSPTTSSTTRPATTTTDGQPPGIGDGRGGVALTEVGDFDQPLYVTQPDDHSGDLYVVEQAGRVMRLPGGEGKPELFLDLSDEVSCCGEQGLLSVAFAPDYADSGLLYVDYTNTDGDSRVVEYERREGDPPVADSGSARELLAVDQPFQNHNGGLALFGPDGKLYIGLGDGGSEGDPSRNGQDLSTLLGKILRLDPQDSGTPPIFAYGLRNPWRFSFDRESSDLWIGDVGQDTLEEIDSAPANELGERLNFGWSAFEGDRRLNSDQAAPGALAPTLVYGHDQGCSVTGGYVVRDPAVTSLYGRYLYGDYCAGQLRSFTARAGERAADDRPLGVDVPGLSSFGEDVDGHIYATSLDGPVYRLDPES
jgi:glucose/arabinose dehydrogenase